MKMVYANMFSSDVQGLVMEASKLKAEIFRSSYQNRRIDINVIHKFLAAVNNMIGKYSDVFMDTQDAMKNGKVDPEKHYRAISYNLIKDYLYGKYDYASVLNFVDGMYKGIDDGKFVEKEDITDFFLYTANKAFKNMPESVADIVSTANTFKEVLEAPKSDIKKFEAVMNQTLYNKMDRRELGRSIEKVLDYLFEEINKNGRIKIKSKDVEMEIAFIQNAIEYISYSVAVYMFRAFVINAYAVGYLYDDHTDVPEAIEESVQAGDKLSKYRIEVMQKADEMLYRDPKDFNKFADLVIEFNGLMGNGSFDKPESEYRYIFQLKDEDENMFRDALYGNCLYEFIGRMGKLGWEILENPDILEDLKNFMNKPGIGGDGMSSKQELITTIRDFKDTGITIPDDLPKITEELSLFALNLLSRIRNFLRKVNECKIDNVNWVNNKKMTTASELIKLSRELYTEIFTATMYRLRAIEALANKNKEEELSTAFAAISIDIPGNSKVVDDTKYNMMVAVPDTITPVPLEAMPAYESFTMYSEYANHILGDASYFSEAVDMSKAIDALLAIITTWYKKAVQFFSNQQVAAAANWVANNKSKLAGMTFNGPMEVLPYKQNINYPSIDAFVNKINSFTVNDAKTEEALNKFIDGLYTATDPNLVKLWKSNDKNVAIQIENYVLFGVQPGTEVTTKTLNSSEDIKKELTGIWVTTVLAAETVANTFKTSEQAASASIKNFKSKIAGLKVSSGSANAAPAITDNENNNPQETNADQDRLTQDAIRRIQEAYQKIVFPSYMIFRKAILDQYNYIKTAYASANK